MLYERAIHEKGLNLLRLDSYRNWGLTTVTFTFTAYAYMMGQGLDPFWRFVLANVSFILVFHFFMLETINIIYIWNYNDVIKKMQDLFLSESPEWREELLILNERIANVRCTKCLQQTFKERIRTPFFPLLMILLLVWIWELIQGFSGLSFEGYVGVLALDCMWIIYEIWNTLTYPIFKCRKPLNRKSARVQSNL